MQKYIRFIKKIFNGENPVEVSLPKEQWDLQFKKGHWGFLLDAPQNVRAVAGIIAQQEHGKTLRILDIGCGNGIIPQLLSQKNLKFLYVGTDISKIALEQAKEKYPNGEYICADMLDTSQITGTFDIIIFCEMLLYGNSCATLDAYKEKTTNDTVVVISLYRTWRTIIIWFLIRNKIIVKSKQKLFDPIKKIRWDVKLCKLKL